MSSNQAPIEHTLHAHSRAITDINFSAFHPDMLATCAVDAFVHCWDLRTSSRPVISFSDWFAGATQVKWNRRDSHIIASTHDKFLRIWDDRKGALPLKTIEAHETKIYGVDWNRTETSKLITCSLDRTIKLWDYEVSETEPERIIHTPFPVWRARHTPFADCLLAMPQRGNNDLHLYDRREENAGPIDSNGNVEPNYTFTGHQEQAKEFLWRARGTIDNHSDNRDFQLITWGTDRELIMHRMGQKQLQAAGFQKGMKMGKSWALTRRGAPYKTFREKPQTPAAPLSVPTSTNASTLAVPSTSPGMSKAPIPSAGGWTTAGSMMTYSGMETRTAKQKNKDPITWMKGVRFGKQGPTDVGRRKSRRMSIMADLRAVHVESLPENLSDEIVHVGGKFTKVTFEEADISSRHVKLSLNGPWASDGKLAFLQLRIEFPQDYPEAAPPIFQLEYTSSLPDSKFSEIENGLRTIAAGYLVHRRGCLEAVLSYLLGETNLQDSTDWLTLGDHTPGYDSSSDEEDALLGETGTGESQTLDMEASMGSGILSANANVPLPRTCGAIWAQDGRLVCFLQPKDAQKSTLQHTAFGDSNRTKGGREIFEGFGRLHADSPDITKGRGADPGEDSDSDSDDASSTSSVGSSTTSSGGPDMIPSRFRPPEAWHGGSLRFQKLKPRSQDSSLPTINSIQRRPFYVKPKTFVALRDVSELLPSKRYLAEEYILFGDGPLLCSHNAEVASKHKLQSLADIWELIKLILSNNVPLDIVSRGDDQESVPVLAQRAVVQIKRKDSGLDINFGEPEGLPSIHGTGLVKWGKHPFSGTWLVQKLFDHFERNADVQMLAMLSCVFAQFLEGESLGLSSGKAMPRSMTLPAQSADYYPTREAAMGILEPTISVLDSPMQDMPEDSAHTSGSTGCQYADPLTPFAVEHGLPVPLSRRSTQLGSTAQSLSTSPSQHRVSIPSATSSFAASVWARPFNLASSPPVRQRMSVEELSSSIPSNNGPNWSKAPKHNFYRSDSTIRNSYAAHGLADDIDEGSSTEEDEPARPRVSIRLKMTNQALFDGEATANIPLLTSKQTHKYVCYRDAYAHMLGVWGLSMQQNEMLKYNGLSRESAEVGNRRLDRESQSTLTTGGFDGGAYGLEKENGPHMVRCCAKCLNVENNAVGGKLESKCFNCGEKWQIMPCTICLEPVLGLYKVCLACGHGAHASCYRSLLESFGGGPTECEAGCGCSCEDHSVVGGEQFASPDLLELADDVVLVEDDDGAHYRFHGRHQSVSVAGIRRADVIGKNMRYHRAGSG